MQAIRRQARGLYSQFNRLEAPQGALAVADDCVIDRPGVIEKRRGFKRYGTALSSPASALMKYQKRLLVLDGSTLKRDSDGAGTWSSYSGSFSAPSAAIRMSGVEAQGSFYFTSSNGPQKLDALTGTPRRAGIPSGLDSQASVTGTGGSWFSPDTQVSYRIAYVKIDANNQESIGEPTERETLANAKSATLTWARSGGGPYTITVTHTAHGYTTSDTVEISDSSASGLNGPQTITVIDANSYSFSVSADPGASGTLKAGKKFNVSITTTIPSGIVANDYYEVYRTALSASASTDPGDRHRLIQRVQITSSDITAGTVTFSDTYDTTFLGEDLYTNPLEETVSNANSRPPWCKFIVAFKGHVWYANTTQPQRLRIQLTSITGLVDDTDSVTISGRTYTFSTAENQGANKFKRFTTGTSAENVRNTAKSLAKILNRDSGNTSVYARYDSGFNDAPGFVTIFARSLNTASFAVTCNASGTGDNFSPILPTSGTTVSSKNDEKKNGIYPSKYEQAEAVPLGNSIPLGRANAEILGVAALQDALFVYKEDGIYVITGETDGASGSSFVTDEANPSITLLAPASLVSLDNAVYGYTSQGVVSTAETGSRIKSWPVETDLLRIASLANFATLAHGVSYESERKFLFATQERSGDAKVKVIWVWNYLTETWCRWRKNVSAGIVLELAAGGDRLYLAHNTDNYILEERKSLLASDEDYYDESIDFTVASSGTVVNSAGITVTTVTGTYTYTEEDLEAGWLFEQGTTEGIVKSVVDNGSNSFTLTLDRQITVSAGAATVSIPIRMSVEWMPEAVGNVGVMKQFAEVQVYLEKDGGTHRLGFCADTQLGNVYTDDIEIVRVLGWGSSAWGTAPWGDAQPSPSNPLRTDIPRDHQRARAIRVIYQNRYAKENARVLQLAVTFRAYSERTMGNPR